MQEDHPDHRFSPGQNVMCTILKPESGGYRVLVWGRKTARMPGFLPSKAKHRIGDDVLTMFVCIDDRERVLLADQFTRGEDDSNGSFVQ